ncbi:MAG: hypothetical protein J1F42_10960 [Lachnospiraceae bacterium]|nr:hypothetical protein [Lachnospiraceae bacterium]
MLFSKLLNDDFIYINMHAESALDFQDDFQEIDSVKESKNNQRGIYTNSVSALILDELMKLDTDRDLALDMEWISEITVNNLLNMMKVIQKFLAREKNVHILYLSEEMESLLEQQCEQKGYSVKKDGVILHISADKKSNYDSCEDYLKQFEKVYIKKLQESIKLCIDERNEQEVHSSGAVYLKKYINVKKMLTKGNEAFLCYCIYKAAMELVRQGIVNLNYAENSNISLFFHTINGAYIGGIMSALLQMNFVYLDHLGPINAIKKQSFENNIQLAKKYIIVADVICTTSEVGRAETLIEFNGGSILCRVCFADVCVVLKQDRQQISCININAEDNFLDYTIKTELCKNCEEKYKGDSKEKKKNE